MRRRALCAWPTFWSKGNFEGALGFGTRGDCAARLRCQRPRSPPIRAQVPGQHDRVRPWRHALLAEFAQGPLPRVGPRWDLPCARRNARTVPMYITHASRGAGNVAHKASSWRINKACTKLLSIQRTAWVQQRLPQAHVKGWAWQDQWILRLSSKSECKISLLC